MGTVIATRSKMRAPLTRPPHGAAGGASWIAASDPESAYTPPPAAPSHG